MLEKERREATEAKERLARSGSVQLELETVNRKLVEGAVRTSDIEKAMQVIDSNNNGVIDYTEFIAACMYS